LFVADGIVFPVYRAWQAMPIRIDEAREAFMPSFFTDSFKWKYTKCTAFFA
jgi:hypothetical protein